VIYYATAKGLTAADVLGRTRGSIAWGAFYTLFVALAAAHAATGIRVILREWTGLAASARDGLAITFGLALLLLGLRAVAAVVLP
jgi:fumarate reductase subunit C